MLKDDKTRQQKFPLVTGKCSRALVMYHILELMSENSSCHQSSGDQTGEDWTCSQHVLLG